MYNMYIARGEALSSRPIGTIYLFISIFIPLFSDYKQ